MTTLSFSESLKSAIQVAISFAREYKNEQFSLPHLLRGLLHKDSGLHPFLNSLGKDDGYMTEEDRMEFAVHARILRVTLIARIADIGMHDVLLSSRTLPNADLTGINSQKSRHRAYLA